MEENSLFYTLKFIRTQKEMKDFISKQLEEKLDEKRETPISRSNKKSMDVVPK